MAGVQVYSKEMCGFCYRAKKLLQEKGVPFDDIDAAFDPDLRKEMVQRSGGAMTYPQIFIGERHVGGCTELQAADASGELDQWLKDAGIEF